MLQKAISGWEQELGFTTTPQRSTRNPAVALADLDYADDICLISDQVEKAQELLKSGGESGGGTGQGWTQSELKED